MKVIQGKYNKANVYASIIDDITISQVEELLNQEFIKKSHNIPFILIILIL